MTARQTAPTSPPASESVAPPPFESVPTSRSSRVLKRFLDVSVAAAGTVVLSPLLVAVAVAVRRSSPGPILFKQERVGQGEQLFTLYKFRTMFVDNSDAEHRAFVTAQLDGTIDLTTPDGAFKLDDPRVTAVGTVLRRYSLDELPQLLNVLNGTMSLVGPRPSLQWEIELYEDRHRGRAAAIPGCSGLWQVSGRNRLSTTQMLDLDLRYIRSWSLAQDLSILLRTVPAVVRGDGAR